MFRDPAQHQRSHLPRWPATKGQNAEHADDRTRGNLLLNSAMLGAAQFTFLLK